MRFLIFALLAATACGSDPEPTRGQLLLETVWVDYSDIERQEMCELLDSTGYDGAWDLISDDLQAEGVTRPEFIAFFNAEC